MMAVKVGHRARHSAAVNRAECPASCTQQDLHLSCVPLAGLFSLMSKPIQPRLTPRPLCERS